MKLTNTESKILGFLITHGTSKETDLCLGCNLKTQEVFAALSVLQKEGLVTHLNYPAHIQEWRISRSVTLEELGRYFSNQHLKEQNSR